MKNTFQQRIDSVMANQSCNSAEGSVHFYPVGEIEHRQEILTKLREGKLHSSDKPRVHIGVAGGFNFSICSITRPDRILLLDMNRHQKPFWRAVIRQLANCDTPAAFRQAFKGLNERFVIRAKDGHPDYLKQVDWMQPENYAYLHHMAASGCMAAATMDIIEDRQAACNLGGALKADGLEVDTCYWSNVGAGSQPYRKMHSRFLDNQKWATHHASHGDVYNTQDGGLCYPNGAFYGRPANKTPLEIWDGQPKRQYRFLPTFERMLINISEIGADPHTMHILASSKPRPLILSEGPLRRIEDVVLQTGRKTFSR